MEVDRGREEPRRARDELRAPGRRSTSSVARVDEAPALEACPTLLDSTSSRRLNVKPCRAPRARSPEQVRDRLVAERGDADAPARAHERDRLPSRPATSSPSPAGPARRGSSRRARARPRHRVEPRRASGGRRSRISATAGQRPASPAGYARRSAAAPRACPRPGSARPGISAAGSGSSARAFPRRSVTVPRSSSTGTTERRSRRPGRTPRPSILCSCGGKLIRVDGRLPVLDRRLADEVEPADRVRVLDQLVLVELRLVEPLPPLRLRLALVVVEEIAEQPAGPTPPPRPRAAPLQRRPLDVPLLRLLALLALLGRQPPRHVARTQRERATRGARPSSGSPPRCSARMPSSSASSRASSHCSKRTTDSSPPATSAVRTNP